MLTVQQRGPCQRSLCMLTHEAALHLTSHSSFFGLSFLMMKNPEGMYFLSAGVKRRLPCPFSPLLLPHTGLTNWHNGPALFQSLLSVDGDLLLLKWPYYHIWLTFFIDYDKIKEIVCICCLTYFEKGMVWGDMWCNKIPNTSTLWFKLCCAGFTRTSFILWA